MGEISRFVKVNGVRVKALYDSGASNNFLSKRVADKLRLYLKGRRSFVLADGKKVVGQVSGVWVEIDDRGGSTGVVVSNILPQDGYDLILGQEFLQDNEVELDFADDSLRFGGHQPKVRRVGRLL